jgi:hypothetical protein
MDKISFITLGPGVNDVKKLFVTVEKRLVLVSMDFAGK